ncbi:MAG: glycosyltransferase [Planctomycetaceae bacterium]
MPRLLINATAYGDPPGGAGLRARHLFGALEGYDLRFLLAEDTPLTVVPDGVPFDRLPVRAAAPLRRRLRLRLRLPEEGDLILTDHWPVARLPTIVTAHDTGGSLWRRALLRRNLRRATAAVCVSAAVRAALGVRADVVPNGYDPPPPAPAPPPPPYLLFSDPALAHKGAPLARAAARALGLPLHEVGRGARWLGRAEMDAALAGAAAVLCPSRTEGFGMVALEAMALGVPVVASDLPAHREVLGEVAFFAQPGDAGAFCAATREALACPRDRRERGRERARGYSWRAAARSLAKVIERVLSGK